MNLLVPTSWLRDYLKTDIAAKSLATHLSLSGPSVEKSQKIGEDVVFDIEITTNRPDTNSILGIAREAYAILNWNKENAVLRDPDGIKLSLFPDKKDLLKLDVQITDAKLCPRFTAIVVDNVQIKDSPAHIKNRLQKCGIRPLNNIIDISNYLMLELGQPMHMFDYDKIKGSKMTLRKSRKGESIRTLDGQNRKLPEGSIIIEDSERLIDLCGIMGGENSAVSKRTKRVIIFVQSYDRTRIRKTTQTLAFRTDAAARFEKGIDTDSIPQALSRAVFLSKKIAGAQIASELIDIYPNPVKYKTIELSEEKLINYMGIPVKLEDANKILALLGFKTQNFGKYLHCTPPPWRVTDVLEQEDLIEEVTRIYGYHNLPSDQPKGIVPNEPKTDLGKVIKLKNALKNLGLTETISYSIISENFLALTGLKKNEAVELANPLTNEWQYMRPTLLVSLASVIAQNQNLSPNIKIFEIAKTYLLQNNDLPKQDLYLSIAAANHDFYKIKGLVENIFQILGYDIEFKQLRDAKHLFEDNLSATIESHGKTIGALGILDRKITDHFGLKETVSAAEINLTASYRLPIISSNFHPIPKYPPVIEDISAVFDEGMPAAKIISESKKAGSPLAKKVEIVDIYRSDKIGKNKKSVSLRLYYQIATKTPSTEDVAPVREKIITHLETLGAHVRK